MLERIRNMTTQEFSYWYHKATGDGVCNMERMAEIHKNFVLLLEMLDGQP